MLALTLAAMLASTPGQTSSTVAPPPPAQEEGAVRLEDVEVTGRRLDSVIHDFINEVAAPNYNRGLARWTDSVCIGAAYLSEETARHLIDRVSAVADDLEMKVGAPGCTPNILIVATDDANRLAQGMVDRSPRSFRVGGSGMDRGGAELRRFLQSDRPVRWWQVSMPYDTGTGMRATRIPGDGTDNGQPGQAMMFAPNSLSPSASRLTSHIQDKIFSTIVVLDINKLDGLSINQLGDYIAMVSFAQIDPAADTSRYASILNLFADPQAATGLTQWDKTYLAGLYEAQRTLKNVRAGRTEIAASIHRTHGRLTATPGD